MGAHDYFIFVTPHFLYKLDPDRVARFGGKLVGFEALTGVMGQGSSCFSKPFFGDLHLLAGGFHGTVDAGYVVLSLKSGLVFIGCVVQHLV